jgi:hypothetical protein
MSCRHNGIGEERIHQGTGCLTCFTSADAYTREATRTYDCVPSTNINPRVESSCHNTTFLHNSARRGLSSDLPVVDWPVRICRRALVRPRHPPRSGTRRASDCATRQPALADWHSPTGSHRLALSRRLVHTDWFTPTGSRRLAYADWLVSTGSCFTIVSSISGARRRFTSTHRQASSLLASSPRRIHDALGDY